ncbi:MAG: HAD family hydrolase, partial [Treponema sp.]|nr:HAD family hydrolase [Treponema sp.]
VAFDIDGTLYENWKLNSRIVFHFFSHLRFFTLYGLARVELRKTADSSDAGRDFYKLQAELMAKKLHCSEEKARESLDRIVYSGLKKYFTRFDVAEGSRELIVRLKQEGFKVALLSDFPPEQKGEIWGLKSYCDVLLGTEETGALKPSNRPFLELADRLQVVPEEILYVGNNHKYDVVGPHKLGMKAAWFVSPRKGRRGVRSEVAELTFWKYSQLEEFIFGDVKESKPN